MAGRPLQVAEERRSLLCASSLTWPPHPRPPCSVAGAPFCFFAEPASLRGAPVKRGVEIPCPTADGCRGHAFCQFPTLIFREQSSRSSHASFGPDRYLCSLPLRSASCKLSSSEHSSFVCLPIFKVRVRPVDCLICFYSNGCSWTELHGSNHSLGGCNTGPAAAGRGGI